MSIKHQNHDKLFLNEHSQRDWQMFSKRILLWGWFLIAAEVKYHTGDKSWQKKEYLWINKQYSLICKHGTPSLCPICGNHLCAVIIHFLHKTILVSYHLIKLGKRTFIVRTASLTRKNGSRLDFLNQIENYILKKD